MSRVLIAGGGVGGASLAILLGRAGVEVELFERSTFPREKPCGEGLMPAGVATLERMGLASAIGGAPFFGVRYIFPKFKMEGRFPSRNGEPTEGRGQRRLHLDGILFAAASATPGVSARTGAKVDAPIVENGRVTGLIVDGEQRRGDLVIAADGLNSPIRKTLGTGFAAAPQEIWSANALPREAGMRAAAVGGCISAARLRALCDSAAGPRSTCCRAGGIGRT